MLAQVDGGTSRWSVLVKISVWEEETPEKSNRKDKKTACQEKKKQLELKGVIKSGLIK